MEEKDEYFVFTDIHGFYSILKKELIKQGFDENNENHMLISLGDNFDRGNENYEMYDKNKIILVKGNYEDVLLEMFKRGFPIYRDFANRTYDTVNQMFQKYFQTKNDLTPEDFKDIYKRME